MTKMLPQIILLIMIALDIGYEFGKQGQKVNREYNGWGAIFAWVLFVLVLWWGGFF